MGVVDTFREGWVGGPENGKFPLLYVVKMFLGLKTLLRNMKMDPDGNL